MNCTLAGQGGGVIQGTASEAILVVLLAARDKVLRKLGRNSLEKLVVYASDQTHAALQKACQVFGYGTLLCFDLIRCLYDLLIIHLVINVNINAEAQ